MNKVIPITDEQLLRLHKNLYRHDNVSLCYIEDTFVGWYVGLDCIDKMSWGTYLLDTSLENELTQNTALEHLTKLIQNILGTKNENLP